MSFVPTNEMGVREVFAAKAESIGLSILESRSPFPDYVLSDRRNAGEKRIRAEAEFKSGNFVNHGHDPEGCDLVICWEHNASLPIEVLELQSMEFYEPDESVTEGSELSQENDEFLSGMDLFRKAAEHICEKTPELDDLFAQYWEREIELTKELIEHRGCFDGPSKRLAESIDSKIFKMIGLADYEIISSLAKGWRANHRMKIDELISVAKLLDLIGYEHKG